MINYNIGSVPGGVGLKDCGVGFFFPVKIQSRNDGAKEA
jgi:hypothetical protein